MKIFVVYDPNIPGYYSVKASSPEAAERKYIKEVLSDFPEDGPPENLETETWAKHMKDEMDRAKKELAKVHKKNDVSPYELDEFIGPGC